MRPAYTVPDIGTLREITLWKAIVLSIITFGIYYVVVVYQNTHDIQEARKEPLGAWKVLFWFGIILGPLHIVLYAFNGIGCKEFRARQGDQDDSLWIVALVLAVLIAPVGQIIWAVTFNGWLRQSGTLVQAPTGSAATPA